MNHMRKLLFLCIGLHSLIALKAQETLIIEGSKPSYYLNHKVLPKENFYSIGRLYNISPKEIAPFNNMDLAKGLSLNQSIHIPLTSNNFVLTSDPVASGETLVPVYHIVNTGDNVKKVAAQYDDASENIKKWNGLKSDALIKGKKIIVGYLKVSKELSAFANKNIKKAPLNDSLKQSTVALAPIKKTKTIIKTPPPPPPSKEPNVNTVINTSSNTSEGFFKNLYQEQMKNRAETMENGPAGIFKSTSGWQDAKYYCFYNAAPQGTIVKISNTKSGKAIYAKVLDLIPEIKQNTGLILQLSNAAAESLSVTDQKFDCAISWSK